MAYGVKYRLDFRDDRGYLRRVDILKNNYTGGVNPWYGTDNPVEIEWATDDDEYSPIIGSFCRLNLMVTDSVYYENFFEYDEREYQIKVYFEDGAGGWNLYWMGFVTNDLYSEFIGTTPYSIQIVANDGLGTLKGKETFIANQNLGGGVWIAVATLFKIIYEILFQTGLNFDIYISNDIRKADDSVWKNIFADVSIESYQLFKSGYTVLNSHEGLSAILRAFNCRIFQSQGKWVIANNSSYGEQRVLDYIQANQGASESTILGVKQGYLNAGEENIKYWKYNYQGTEIASETINKLATIPTTFQQVGNSLYKRVKRPYKKVTLNIDTSQEYELERNNFANGSFELVGNGWTDYTGNLTFDGFSKSGQRGAKFPDVSGSSQTTLALNYGYGFDAIKVPVLKMSVYFENSSYPNELTSGFNYSIGWQVTKVSIFGGSTYYWDNTNSIWTLTSTWNNFTTNQTNQFVDFSQEIGECGGFFSTEVNIAVPFFSLVGHQNTHIDNVFIERPDSENTKFKTKQVNRYQSTNNVSELYVNDNLIFENNVFSTTASIYGSDYKKYKRVQDSTGKKIEEIVSQQILNDFRNYLEIYEGSFTTKSASNMIDLTNKIWLKMSTWTESDSGIVNKLKVNLKRNQYDIGFYIPHNYTDVANTYYENYEK